MADRPEPPDRVLRHARWLIDQVLPDLTDTPAVCEAVRAARELLGQAAGDYDEAEVATWTQAARDTAWGATHPRDLKPVTGSS